MWRDVERSLSGQSATSEVFPLPWGDTHPLPGQAQVTLAGDSARHFRWPLTQTAWGLCRQPQWGPNAICPGEATLLNNNNTIPGYRR